MASVREQIDAAFKKARLERDEPTKTVIGMLKNKVLTELKSGRGAQETDELWLSVLTAYAKQTRKSIPELEKAGERGQELVDSARFEIQFCEQFLPTKLGPEDTEKLVRQVVEKVGASSPGDMGKVMGAIMKDHRDEVDGKLAKNAAQKILAEKAG